MRVALVCDSMSAYGGAEKVVEQILSVYPKADLFSVLDVVPEGQRAFLDGRRVHCSFLQRLPYVKRYYRKLLHFWPYAVEQLDICDYDLVLSSHHSVAYGVLTRPEQVHVSYIHSPMRYAWDLQHEYLKVAKLDRGLVGMVAKRTLHKVRMWDYVAAQRPDAIIANSHFVAQRLRKVHRRDAAVIYPPVSLRAAPPAAPAGKGDYYLSVGRLVPYKRVDLLVRAFAGMPHQRLKVVGAGPELRKVTALAPPNVEVVGYQSDEAVRDLMAGAKAYVFAGIEDFGITAVEAQALGTPVIAYRAGGLVESVTGLERPGPTGVFFDEQNEAAIVSAVETFEANRHRFRPEIAAANAARFSEQRFRQEFREFVEETLVNQLRPAGATPGWRPQVVPPGGGGRAPAGMRHSERALR